MAETVWQARLVTITLAMLLVQIPTPNRPVTPNFPIVLGAIIIVGIVIAAWLIVIRRRTKE